MGLAASQARFLAITARKMNCEFQSMQIAQEKLSTTRDLQRAATDYQNSLDATKLVWDVDGTRDGSGDVYELSYDVMMKPSTLNEFTPHLITDTRGKVVLSNKMFEAAVKAGIIDQNGDPTFGRTYTDSYGATRTNTSHKPYMGDRTSETDGSRNAFLHQLGLVNQLDGTMVNNILALGQDGYTTAGIGGPIFDKSTANVLKTNEFINYMKKAKAEDTVVVEPGHQYGYNVSAVVVDANGNVTNGGTGYKYESTASVPSGGSTVNLQVLRFSAGQTINSDVPLYYKLKNDTTADTTGTIDGHTYVMGENIPAGNCIFKRGDVAPFGFTVAIETNVGSGGYVYGVGNVFSSVFNSTNNANSTTTNNLSDQKFTIVKNGQSLSNNELENLTMGDLLNSNCEIVYNGTDYKNKFESMLTSLAKVLGYDDLTHIVGLNVDTESHTALNLALQYTKQLLADTNRTNENTKDPASLYQKATTQTNIIKSSQNNMAAISLTNLMKAFLTNFARAIDGLGTTYMVDNKATKYSNFVTNDLSYPFILANDGAMTDEIDLNADFYNMMYNVIATTGACTDEMLMNVVSDKSLLHEAIKNGSLFVSSLNTDGFFYQGAYSLTNYVVEVPDEDAIARAERDYEVTKSRLNTKEETLELKMKNLDMEISSLTTEFDTVKNLISKGVEKVFTMFST